MPSEVSPGPVEPQAKPEVPPPPERKSSLTPKGESEAEPLPPKPDASTDTPKETPKPKRVAQRHDRQAMFEGNPFGALFNW
jgi:hypothetical protein